jgi:SAM-dependent methyltransferase
MKTDGSSPPPKRQTGQEDFYADTLAWLLERGVLRKDMKILLVCGGPLDRDVLLAAGFQNVTISNLDSQMKPGAFAPFAACVQDVEALTYGKDEFDFCIAHNGLHHCYSPQRGMLEMYRVSRLGVLVFEPRDSVLTRLGVRLGFGQEYETAAVAANGCVGGGTRDTPIPNYVYRWTEREIEKSIRSYTPWGKPGFIYRRGLRVPWGRLEAMNSRICYLLVRTLLPLMRLFFLCFPGQANGFAFVALKPRIPQDFFPWLELKDGQPVPNREWMRKQYNFQSPPEKK